MYLPAHFIFPQILSFTTILFGLFFWIGTPVILSAEPPAQIHTDVVPLEKVQHVLIETLALTERGIQESTGIQQVVSDRLAEAGFTPLTQATAPHDIMVRVKCEERKTRTGPSKHRKGGHPLSTASRHWKGPTCHISYRYQGKPALWSWEVRTSFEDSRKAAKEAGARNSGQYALQELQAKLVQDEFPLYLTAEWGQTDRLIDQFQLAKDQIARQRLILQLLGPLTSSSAHSTLEEATKNPELAATAIAALGNQGEVAIPSLANILDTSESSEQRLAALQALGGIATHSPVPALYDQFIQQLQSSDPRMQTIAVRGLGTLGNQDAMNAIETLNIQAWSNPSTHADMQDLREALNDTLYQLDPQAGSH